MDNICRTTRCVCKKHGKVGTTYTEIVAYTVNDEKVVDIEIVSRHCVYCLSDFLTSKIGQVAIEEVPNEPA